MSRATRLNTGVRQNDATATFAPQAGVRYGTKRAGYVCSSPSGTTVAVTEGVIRHPLMIPVTTSRWRLHIRNWQPATATVYTGAVNVNGVWVGKQDFNKTGSNAGAGFGRTTAAPVAALGAFSTPADGSEYVSGWVTDPSAQFAAYTSQIVSLGFTTSATIATSTGASCFISTGAGTAATASVQGTAPSNTLKTAYFDMWVEYEFTGTNPVVLFVGDSLTAGQTTTSGQANALQGTLTDHSYPHQYGLIAGVCALNAGIAGITSGGMVSATNGAYTRFGLGGTGIQPDSAVIALGSNDVLGRQPWYQVAANLITITDILRGFGIGPVYAATVMPRNFNHGTITADASAAVTSVSTTAAFANGDVVVLGYGTANAETLTVSGASTGAGPYTTTFTAATTKAHTNGDLILRDQEAFRRDTNNWIRQVPYTWQGLADFDLAMALTSDPAKLDPYVSDPDATHLIPIGYRRMASALPTHLARN